MKQIDIYGILDLIPHRYPFLLIDRVLSVEDNSVCAIKNVTVNEPFFIGHFPKKPVMPGVLQIEAMAQTGGIFCAIGLGKLGIDVKTKLLLLTSIDKVKFKKPVVPGDVLRIEANILKFSKRILKMDVVAKVDDEVVSMSSIGSFIIDKSEA